LGNAPNGAQFRDALYSVVAKEELRSQRIVVVKGLRQPGHGAGRVCRCAGFCRRLAGWVGL